MRSKKRAASKNRAGPAGAVRSDQGAGAPAPRRVRSVTPTAIEAAFEAPPAPSGHSSPPAPAARRRHAIFFDVENTSRAEHLARVIDHLKVDRMGERTEFFAVGNWRMVGPDTARLLERHGASLIHSAPSVGVQDWTDLRIAVAAGIWLVRARPGDRLEIVSDDRAFDAVGDVAASLGIAFRRLSHRILLRAGELRAIVTDSGHGGRRGRSRRPHGRHRVTDRGTIGASNAAFERRAETAGDGEIVQAVRVLLERSSSAGITIDALANALKSRGVMRTPGSPRLVTRLRRIRALALTASGFITMRADPPGLATSPVPVGSRKTVR